MSKQQYKEVQMGPRRMRIPEHWEKTKLGELAEYQNGYGFSSSDWGDEGLPIIRIQNLTNSAGEETNHYDGELDDKYIIVEGDLLVSWSATLGVFKWGGPKAALNQHIFKVNSKDKVDEDFLYYLLDQNLDILERKIHGTTMKHITKSTFENTFVSLPPLPEQRRIAEILSTVDEAIQQTDEIIETSKELKKGLMQDLLTKGIGHEEFKEIQLGPKDLEIPQTWEIKTLGQVCEKVSDGTHESPPTVDEEDGYPFITGKHVTSGKIDFDSCLYLSPEEHEKNVSRCNPEKGDVLFTHIGTIGEVVTVDRDIEFSIKNIALLKPSEEVGTEFLKSILEGEVVQNFVTRITQGGVQNYLGLETISGIKLPVPPLDEQREIAERLSVVDEKIREEEEYREKLEELKKGLMQDLLTGEVRVEV